MSLPSSNDTHYLNQVPACSNFPIQVKDQRTTPELTALSRRIENCQLCPRLRRHCQNIALVKRRAFLLDHYWGKPVSGFGDPRARLVIVGLAPAAHGANRTGRIFTGDRSGEWLYRALHKAGFANQATAVGAEDGLQLRDAWVTCAVRCAPPGNKPSPKEFENCRPFFREELALLTRARIYVALGGVALATLQTYLVEKNLVREKTKWKFQHGAEFTLKDERRVIASFHPSQQNTFTKRLTEPMFDRIFHSVATSP